tara:strand:+ start:11461 stop:12126 length:666 start_codon:yes stop_codon:yes gene_type:complete
MLTLLFFILVLLLATTTGPKRETFVKKSNTEIILNDPLPNMTEYKKVSKVSANHDVMEKIVLATNKYILEKTGIDNYIIETTALKQFRHKQKNHDMYRCMFMIVKKNGFAHGASITADIMVVNNQTIGGVGTGGVRVLSARSQPMDIKPPADSTPFESVMKGSTFIPYEDIQNSQDEMIKALKNPNVVLNKTVINGFESGPPATVSYEGLENRIYFPPKKR